MAPRPTVIGSRVIGVDLPAFLLSKNFYSESIGMSHLTALRLRQKSPWDFVWRDLSGRVARPRLPAPLTSASAEFLLRVLVALRLASEIPRGTSRNQSLATNHCRKIKNPPSSARPSHPPLLRSTRSSLSFYPYRLHT